MKLWLDDLRPAPEGWVHARTAEEAIAILEGGAVEEVSLDHDLGDEAAGTGLDVAAWIEDAAVFGTIPRVRWAVHTSNPVGRHLLTAALENAERAWALAERDLRRLRFDEPVAVIGDIHGRADLLRGLLDRLPPSMPVLVVGDLCDRGPDTRGVLDLLVARGADGVRGNHDEWFTAWASRDGFDSAALSPMMGGSATLSSYGVIGRTSGQVEADSWRVPSSHRALLERLAVAVDLEVQGHPYWLVHAGIPSTEPFVGLSAAQVVPHCVRENRAALLWGAVDPEAMVPVDRPVVMGHVPRRRPLDTGHVLAIDTGCGTLPEGALTAVVLPERRFVTAHP